VIDNRRRAYEIGMTNLQQAGIAIAELGDNTAFWIEVVHGSANAGDWVCFIGGQTSTRVDIVCTLVGFLPGPGSPTFWFSAAKGTALLNVYVDSWLEEYIYNSNIKPSCIYGHLTNNQELLQYCNN
jgi:hypothetical protein